MGAPIKEGSEYPKISIVINLDTRPENLEEGEMGKGVVHDDFLFMGVQNKIDFFKGFDVEVILFVDMVEPLHPMTIHGLTQISDKVVFSKHKPWGSGNCMAKPNDYNYLHALSLARGEYVVHFDMDMAAFTRDEMPIWEMILWLESYDYVSYPSEHSPAPCHDDSFDYWWVSTRFFMCKRTTLNIALITRCLDDEAVLDKYFPSVKKLGWMEHVLGRTAKRGVIYPPFDLTNYAIWSWRKYIPNTYAQLSTMSYDEIGEYINKCRGIFYVCDLTAEEI